MRVKQAKDPRVVFTGYVTDQEVLAELYHNCYAYFHGHEFGGTNPTMLKALAYGCAIIAIDTPFTREMLLDGKHGLFFSKQEDQLTELIGDIDSNVQLLTSFQVISRERIVNNYTWEKIANQYANLFEDMMD